MELTHRRGKSVASLHRLARPDECANPQLHENATGQDEE
jgi:hypothetical protein